MVQNKLLKENIRKNYVFILLQNLDLTRGIWMIYLAAKGMSLTQLGLLETIFHLTSFSMEVPTGAVADLFGRRTSRILGRVFSLASVALLLLANHFYLFAFSFILTALSYNLESGAGDALVYDSLKEIGEENRFMQVNGNKELFFQIASTISFLCGGYLATKSYTLAFGLTMLIGSITLFQSFTFMEPTIGKRGKKHTQENIFISQLKESYVVLKNNPRIGILILFVQVIMTFCTCTFYYLQNFLKGFGYSEATIGLIYAAASLMAALTATQVHRIEKKVKEKGLLLIIPIITAVCIWGMALSRWHFAFFILMNIAEGIIYVAISDYINKMIPSENRATLLSFASMVFSFFMITLFPLIGWAGDHFTLAVAFRGLGVLATLLVAVNCYILSAQSQ